MLTRPGAVPGPAWMRKLGQDSSDPQQFRKTVRRVILAFAILQAAIVLFSDVAALRSHNRHRTYNSEMQIGGLPLLSVGGRAHGVFAVGGVATGVVAIGGVAAGVVAYGGLGLGFIGIGGLGFGLIAIGGAAVGWRALGAVAVGNASFGALAIGRYAYAGPGVALGRDEASGKQKESLFG